MRGERYPTPRPASPAALVLQPWRGEDRYPGQKCCPKKSQLSCGRAQSRACFSEECQSSQKLGEPSSRLTSPAGSYQPDRRQVGRLDLVGAPTLDVASGQCSSVSGGSSGQGLKPPPHPLPGQGLAVLLGLSAFQA